MAERLGNALGIFEDVDSRNNFLFWGASLRIKVRIDLNRPIRRGVRIYPDGPLSGLWVPIRYERLPELCSHCGIIGHLSRDCIRVLRMEREFSSSPQYGDWLRFSGKDMFTASVAVRGDNPNREQETSRSHRLAIAVSPSLEPISPVELPYRRPSGIRINEPAEGGRLRSQNAKSSIRYSLSGEDLTKAKGKAKVDGSTSRIHGGVSTAVTDGWPESANWRSECSSRRALQEAEPLGSLSSDPRDVTEKLKEVGEASGKDSGFVEQPFHNMAVFGPEEYKEKYKEELRASNRRLSKTLLSIFNAAENHAVGHEKSQAVETNKEGDMESDPEEMEEMGFQSHEGSNWAHPKEQTGLQVVAENYQLNSSPNEKAENGGENSDVVSFGFSSKKIQSIKKGGRWKKRARAGFVPFGVNVDAGEEAQKRKDGPLLFSPGNIKRPKVDDGGQAGTAEQPRQSL